MSTRTAPEPPPPERDTGYSGPMPTERRKYRIVTNGTTCRVQVRRAFFIWDTVSSWDSEAYAERWIEEQIRRNQRTSGPWREQP